MSVEENVQIVKDFFAAMGGHNKQGLLAMVAEDIEWIIPGEDWPLAGTHRGRAEVAAVLKKASEEVETTYPKPPEFVAQEDRVLVVGVATGKIKATNKSFKDDWVFDITIRDRKGTKIREDIDTQALARASQMDAATRARRWPFAAIGSGQTVDPPPRAPRSHRMPNRNGDPDVRPIQAIGVDPVHTSRCGLHRHRRLPGRRRLDPSLLRHRGT